MASETTLAAPRAGPAAPGRTEPAAELLARLAPDDLHPALLTGAHAWHPWGLTTRAPTDHQIRLVTITCGADKLERLLDHLQTQLQRPTWPPCPPLKVHRHGSRLDCRDTNGHRATLQLERHNGERTEVGRDVVTRDGWPIVDELLALNDRLAHIDPDRPARDDLTDLARWVHHKMAAPTPGVNLTCPLPQLLRTQAGHDPDASTRLATIVELGIKQAGTREVGPLTYLQNRTREASRFQLQRGEAGSEARQTPKACTSR